DFRNSKGGVNRIVVARIVMNVYFDNHVRWRVHREVEDDPIADGRGGLNVETGIRLVAFCLFTLSHGSGAKEEDVDLKSKSEGGNEIVDEEGVFFMFRRESDNFESPVVEADA